MYYISNPHALSVISFPDRVRNGPFEERRGLLTSLRIEGMFPPKKDLPQLLVTIHPSASDSPRVKLPYARAWGKFRGTGIRTMVRP